MYIIKALPSFLLFATSISELEGTEVVEELSKSNFFMDIMINIFYFIFKMLASFCDMMESVFLEIVNFDFLTVFNIVDIDVQLDQLMWAMVTLILSVVIILKMIGFSHNLDWLRGILTFVLAIAIFSSFYSLMMDFKNAGISTSDKILNREEIPISELIFYENTYDIEASVNTKELTFMNRNIDVDYINPDEVLPKAILNDKIVYKTDGTKEYTSLKDGIGGFGDERYYRWSTNYFIVDLMMFIVFIFYALSSYKLAYISWDLVVQRITGKCLIGTSISNAKRIGTIFMNVIHSVVSIVFLYFTISLFAIGASGILRSELSGLAKIILICAMGMMVIMGSHSFNKTMGIDDGSGFLMKSLFVGRSLKRLGKDVINTGRNAAGVVYDTSSHLAAAVDKGVDMMNQKEEMNIHKMAFADQLHSYNESMKEPLKLTNNDFEEKPIYGFPDGSPGHFHVSDESDQYNERMDKIKSDFLERYNDLDIHTSLNETLPEEQESSHNSNAFSNADESFRKVENEYKYKPYKQYKKDYPNGDTSIEKSDRRSPYDYRGNWAYNKKLPDWVIEDDVKSAPQEKFDLEEYKRELEIMRNSEYKM